jgi:hypothetical protein
MNKTVQSILLSVPIIISNIKGKGKNRYRESHGKMIFTDEIDNEDEELPVLKKISPNFL